MKAWLYDKKILPDKLTLGEVEKPLPKDHEVLVKIHASSVNAADFRSLKMGIIPKKKIFGADIAGIVEEVGSNAKQFHPGDEVMGDLSSCGFGGFAEYAVAPALMLVPKPANISFEQAAAIPLAAITALQALRNYGNIHKGQAVLIVGSGGGVGTFAVQLAKYFGATVTAVCSSKNVEQSLKLGADRVIDYTKEDFTKSRASYDLILAVNGNYPLLAYKRKLNPKGRHVMVGGAMPQIIKSLLFGWAMSFGSKKMLSARTASNQKDLEFLTNLVAAGNISPVIERCFPFAKTVDAIRYLSEGHAQGKLVIKMN